MKLTEYLFIDKKRLDAYLEQIGPPVKYKIIPIWKVKLGFTGLSAEGTQSIQLRHLYDHDKVVALKKHLKDNDLLVEEHATAQDSTTDKFFFDSCEAIRCFIPPRTTGSGEYPGITLWISFNPTNLYLLQDFQDRDTWSGDRGSVYHLTSILIADLYKTVTTEQFAAAFPEIQSAIGIHDFAHRDLNIFLNDPLRTVKNLGCEPGKRRWVKTLYRMREAATANDGSMHVFGYPIVIEATSEKIVKT